MLLAFIPMWLTAVAYRELNQVIPDCGTTFTLGGQGLRTACGLDGRLGVAVAGIISHVQRGRSERPVSLRPVRHDFGREQSVAGRGRVRCSS